MVNSPYMMADRPPPNLRGLQDVPENAQYALILLHGFGDTGAGWFQVLHLLRNALPASLAAQTALFSPDAPDATPFGEGRQWFRDMGWTFRDPTGISRAADALIAFLRHITEAYGIPPNRIILGGFSQGAMTTLYTLPRLASPLAGHISLAGALTAPLAAPLQPVTTPTLLLHGDQDDVLPADASVAAAAQYAEHGLPYALDIIPGMAHEASPPALARILLFIQQHFAEGAPTP